MYLSGKGFISPPLLKGSFTGYKILVDLFIFFKIYLFTFGCAGSSLLCMGFLQLWRLGTIVVVVCGLLVVITSVVAELRLLGAPASVVAVHGLEVVTLGLQSTGLVVVVHELSCSMAYGIFLDQGLNSCLLHWQVDLQPLDHQRSLISQFLMRIVIFIPLCIVCYFLGCFFPFITGFQPFDNMSKCGFLCVHSAWIILFVRFRFLNLSVNIFHQNWNIFRHQPSKLFLSDFSLSSFCNSNRMLDHRSPKLYLFFQFLFLINYFFKSSFKFIEDLSDNTENSHMLLVPSQLPLSLTSRISVVITTITRQFVGMHIYVQSFPGGSAIKNLPTSAEDTSSVPGSG